MMNSQSQPRKQEQAYKKIRVLGEGSMGKAYLVQCSQDHQLYVMKRINIGHLSEQERQNASREAQVHSKLKHENIIAFKEIYQTTKDKLCIIMEYAENGDLDQLIKAQEGKLFDEDTVLRYFVQICLGLREIHLNKIIHRDLKGANIFMGSDNAVKIGDFGISKVLDKTVLASKSFVGTPYYLSPEMVEGRPYSTKADIWALGVILYHMCAQKLPFETNSLPLLALKIIKGSFPPLAGGNYSRELKSLILNLLQVDQRKRPSIDQIFQRPFLTKYLPKELADKVISFKPVVRPAKISSSTGIPKVLKKPKISGEQLKEQEKVKREEYKEKREEMRKQMRADLKKKRKEVEKSTEPQNQTIELNVSAIQLKSKEKKEKGSRKNLSREGPRAAKPEQKKEVHTKKFPVQKPWKNNKPKSKKDIEVEIFLPVDRPRQSKIEKVQQAPPKRDIKVEIFVSGKPFQLARHKQPIENNASKENLLEDKRQIHEHTIDSHQASDQISVENYHYSQKNISENPTSKISDGDQQQYQDSQSEEEIEEEIIPQKNYLSDVLKDVKGIGEIVNNLSNPYGAIELYEQSDNFDNTVEMAAFSNSNKKPELDIDPEDEQNLKYITNSGNLQELRLILEDKLGEEKFVNAYNIIIEHAEQAARKAHETSQQYSQDDYTFNRELLREKLSFLTQQQFDKNIVLLYTLTILEDEEMKNNFESD